MTHELGMHQKMPQMFTATEETVGAKGKSSALTYHLRLPRNLDTDSGAISATRDGLIFLLLLAIVAAVLVYCSKPSRRASPPDEESSQDEEVEEYALPGPHIEANTRMHDTRTFYSWVRASNTAMRAAETSGEQRLRN